MFFLTLNRQIHLESTYIGRVTQSLIHFQVHFIAGNWEIFGNFIILGEGLFVVGVEIGFSINRACNTVSDILGILHICEGLLGNERGLLLLLLLVIVILEFEVVDIEVVGVEGEVGGGDVLLVPIPTPLRLLFARFRANTALRLIGEGLFLVVGGGSHLTDHLTHLLLRHPLQDIHLSIILLGTLIPSVGGFLGQWCLVEGSGNGLLIFRGFGERAHKTFIVIIGAFLTLILEQSLLLAP